MLRSQEANAETFGVWNLEFGRLTIRGGGGQGGTEADQVPTHHTGMIRYTNYSSSCVWYGISVRHGV